MHAECLAVCKMTDFFLLVAKSAEKCRETRIKANSSDGKKKQKIKMVIENRCDVNGMRKKDKTRRISEKKVRLKSSALDPFFRKWCSLFAKINWKTRNVHFITLCCAAFAKRCVLGRAHTARCSCAYCISQTICWVYVFHLKVVLFYNFWILATNAMRSQSLCSKYANEP